MNNYKEYLNQKLTDWYESAADYGITATWSIEVNDDQLIISVDEKKDGKSDAILDFKMVMWQVKEYGIETVFNIWQENPSNK